MNNSRIYNSMAAALAVFLVGCAGSPPAHSPQAQGNGKDMLERALAREGALTGTYKVADADRFFSANVKGSGQPMVQPHEGVYQVTVPIDTGEPAECFIYLDALNSASTLSELVDTPLADMAKTQILKIDAGTFDKHPYLYEEKLYITNEQTVGVLKGIVVPFRTSLLACLHDTPGYRETFLDMTASFAASLVLHEELPRDWQREEVLVWTMRNMNIGYTVNRAIPDENGDIRSTVETAMVIPRSAQETLTHDEFNVTYEQPDGTLINGRYAEAENGNIKVSVKLNGDGAGAYHVSGTFQGKAIDAPLEVAEGVAGPYHQQREMIRAAYPRDGEPRSLVLNTYVPSANPLETIAMEVSPTGTKVEGLPEYEMQFAGLKATGLVDEQGQKSMTVKMGLLELQLSRAYIRNWP